MCFVHGSFRCVVVVPGEKLAGLQTPFLNRFEKHSLSYADMMHPYHRKVVLSLREWVESKCGKQEPCKVFVGYHSHETTLASLVLSQLPEPMEPPAQVLSDAIKRCRELLTATMNPEGRSMARQSSATAAKWHGVGSYLSHVATDPQSPIMSLVQTHSVVLDTTVTVDLLSSFATERSLEQRLSQFWESEANLFVMQIDLVHDRDKVWHVKHVLEEAWVQRQSSSKSADEVAKRVCLVLSCPTSLADGTFPELHFMVGSWRMVTV